MKIHFTNTDNPVDFPKSYKRQVIEAALEGLRQGGVPTDYAQVFEILLDRVFEA